MNELISIGSLGKKNDTVEGVHVRNCSLTKTKYGARIKTFPVSNIRVQTFLHPTTLLPP